MQAAILLTLGLQQREVSDLQQALGLPSNQVRSAACWCACGTGAPAHGSEPHNTQHVSGGMRLAGTHLCPDSCFL
jgi:hypothetical protein